MKTIKIEKTEIKEEQVKFRGNPDKEMDYKDLIEIVLDVVPQGGFTPKDIRERNRIQDALDKLTGNELHIEDADYEALEKLVESSRWSIRHKHLNEFLNNFKDGVYKKKSDKPEKTK